MKLKWHPTFKKFSSLWNCNIFSTLIKKLIFMKEIDWTQPSGNQIDCRIPLPYGISWVFDPPPLWNLQFPPWDMTILDKYNGLKDSGNIISCEIPLDTVNKHFFYSCLCTVCMCLSSVCQELFVTAGSTISWSYNQIYPGLDWWRAHCE